MCSTTQWHQMYLYVWSCARWASLTIHKQCLRRTYSTTSQTVSTQSKPACASMFVFICTSYTLVAVHVGIGSLLYRALAYSMSPAATSQSGMHSCSYIPAIIHDAHSFTPWVAPGIEDPAMTPNWVVFSLWYQSFVAQDGVCISCAVQHQ